LRAPQLFNAIPIRHTYHKRFKPLPLNRGDLNRIRKFLTDEDVRLEVSTDPEVKQRVSELCAHANTMLYGDAGFRDDLRIWAQSGCIGFPWFLSESGQTDDAALLEAGRRLTEQEMQILKSAPAVAVLDSPFDNRLAQVAAGQIFEKLCLEAALLGVRCLPLNQLVEVPEERITVRHIFPGVQGNPLVVFAMGYGNGDSAEVWSPRIPLEEVVAAE